MGISYPSRTNATGIWKLSNIYRNKTTDGTYPGSIGGSRALFFGGWNESAISNVIDFIEVTSTGDATDFGDLPATHYGGSSFSDGVRVGIYGRGSPASNAIEYVHYSTLGNAADFGDAATTRLYSMKASTKVRGFSAGGRTPSVSNVKEFITIASTGNGTDFGDLHTAHEKGGGANNSTRALYGGGSAPGTTNAIGF